MKAIVYDRGNYPYVLVQREIARPIPSENEVLVRIHAVSVNAADYRSMRVGSIPKRKIFGSDIAGRVNAVGKDVRQFAVSDEVLGDISGCGMGGFAEYVSVPEHVLSLKPASVSFEEAAAVPMSGVTALQGLRNLGNIRAGQKVLICGASGGVGTFAVQLAKYFGAEVTAVCSGNNAQTAKSLGADFIVNYQEQDFTKTSKRYDLILAVNGKQSLLKCKRLLAEKGIFVMVGGPLSQMFQSILFGPLLSIGSKKMRFLASKPDAKDLDFVIKLVQKGKIKPVIDRQYPLEETAEAIRYISAGHAKGKVVLNVGGAIK